VESVIKKLHQLQLMAINNNRISVQVSMFNTPQSGKFWVMHISYWHNHDIYHRIDVHSHDKNSNHRIDMMLKYRTLEK